MTRSDCIGNEISKCPIIQSSLWWKRWNRWNFIYLVEILFDDILFDDIAIPKRRWLKVWINFFHLLSEMKFVWGTLIFFFTHAFILRFRDFFSLSSKFQLIKMFYTRLSFHSWQNLDRNQKIQPKLPSLARMYFCEVNQALF